MKHYRICTIHTLAMTVISTALLALGAHCAAGSGLEPLSVEQKLSDFNYLVKIVAENYPFLEIKERATGVGWLDRQQEYAEQIKSAKDDLQFYLVLNRIVAGLQNAHTHIISPSSLHYYRRLYSGSQVWASVMTPEVIEAYSYWQNVVGDTASIRRSFEARYVAGAYLVEQSAGSLEGALPVGARVIAINGEDVQTYIEQRLTTYENLLDPARGVRYIPYLPMPSTESVAVTFEIDGQVRSVTVPRSVEDTPSGGLTGSLTSDTGPAGGASAGDSQGREANVSTAILADGRIAYLRIRSFGTTHVAADRSTIESFLKSVSDYPFLVIDIRGNSGGTDAYWSDLLVAPLTEHPLYTRFYVSVRSGDYVQQFIKAKTGIGYHLLQTGRGVLPQRVAPPEVMTPEFNEPLQLPMVIFPRHQVGFDGKILLLVDDQVYSSAETFAAFAKATGWATIVGTRTGGDGIGFDPFVFSLPNSKLLVRMSESIGLNPDGSANEEFATTPDIFAEPDPIEYSALLEAIQSGRIDPSAPQPELDAVLRKTIEYCTEGAQKSELALDGAKPAKQTGGGLKQGDGELNQPWLLSLMQGFASSSPDLDDLSRRVDTRKHDGMTVSSVRIYGAYSTSEDLIRRLVTLKAGDVFNSRELERSRTILQSLNAVNEVALLTEPDGDGRVRVSVFIQEGWRLFLSPASIGEHLVEDLVSHRISLTVHNVAGRLINITGRYGLSSSRERSLLITGPVVITGPIIAGNRLKASAELRTSVITRALKGGSLSGESVRYSSTASSLSLVAIPASNSQVALRLAWLKDSITAASPGLIPLVESGSYVDASVSASIRPEYQSGDARKGRALVSAKVGALLPALAPLKAHPYAALSLENTLSVARGTSLLGRVDAYYVEATTPILHQLFVGGSGALRAHEPSIYGNRLIESELELRHYLFSDFSISGIVGIGKVWEPGEQLSWSDPLTSLSVVVRYRTPVRLTLEAGYSTSGIGSAGRGYFKIGQQF